MNRRYVGLAFLLGSAALLTTMVVWADTYTGIDRDLVGGGGGIGAFEGVVVEDSVGQPVVGISEGDGVRLEAGFWPGAHASGVGPTPTGDRPTATATRTVRPATATATRSATATRTVGPGVTTTLTPTATATRTIDPAVTPSPTATRPPGGYGIMLPLVLDGQ